MLKVVKFGGSSLADSAQFTKVGNIIKSDARRKFVVPSAPGKRYKGDTKVTDLLYACYAKAEKNSDFSSEFSQIKARYNEIIKGLSLTVSLDDEFAEIEKNFKAHVGSDYAASRGEYLNGILMAAFLGFEFIDARTVIFFNEHGELDAEKTNEILGKKRLTNRGREYRVTKQALAHTTQQASREYTLKPTLVIHRNRIFPD